MRKALNSKHENIADKVFTQNLKQPKEIENHVFQRLIWIMFFAKILQKSIRVGSYGY